MDFVSVRIITDDVARLAGFYERATGLRAAWPDENFAEPTTGSATAAIASPRAGRMSVVMRAGGWAGEAYGTGGVASPARDLGLRVLPGRRVPSWSRSSRTGGRPARSIFLRTWPSSVARKTPPTPVKPAWS